MHELKANSVRSYIQHDNMKTYQIVTSFWVAVLLSYFIKIHCTYTRLTINYKKLNKVRRHSKDKQVPHVLFLSRIEDLRDNVTKHIEDLSSLQERRKRFARDLDDWKQYCLDDTDSIFPTYSKSHPHDLGQLVPGVKKMFLFVLVDIPETDSLKSIEFQFPDCQEWAGSNLHHW